MRTDPNIIPCTDTQILERVREGQALKDGKISVNLTTCRADEVVDELVEIMLLRLNQKDISVEHTTSGSITLTTDIAILRDHVLGNILTNAIKFSSHGSTIHISTRGEADGSTVIAIRDHGIGIPLDILTKIFDPQTCTTRQGTEGEMGTGFGMPLVKRYADLLEAKIQITSKVINENPQDHGTTVEIVLPPK